MGDFEFISALVAIISFAVSFFLAWILLFTPSKHQTNLYLSLTLFIGSGVFILRLLVILKSSYAAYGPLIIFPSVFMIGPLLYFYTRSILYHTIATETEIRKYSLPSIITFFLILGLLLLNPEFTDIESITKQKFAVGIFTVVILFSLTSYLLYFCYLSIRSLLNYQKQLENEFSSIHKGRFVWLKAYIGINLLNIIIYISLTSLLYFGKLKMAPVTPVEGILNLANVYLILYYLIRKPEIITLQFSQENEGLIVNQKIASSSQSKYSKQSLDEKERKNILKLIQMEMENTKPYLEENLSLGDLSEKLTIPAHHISMTINIELQQNFFQFVNSYRIAEACMLLKNQNFKNKNVLNIGLQAGFQSKAAFNKAFKASTGKTPTQFRNEA